MQINRVIFVVSALIAVSLLAGVAIYYKNGASIRPETSSKTRQQELIEAIKAKPFKSIAYVNRLAGYWPPQIILNSLGVNSKCYDIFILTFWMYGMMGDAVSVYDKPLNFIGPDVIGNTNAEIQQNLQKLYHDNGSLLFISAFGAAQNPTGFDPKLVAESLAKWVNENPYIDGIDIDYEDNDAIVDGTGTKWLITFQKVLREKLDNKNLLITHAPQAPYFSRAYYDNGAYYTVEKEVGNTIDWYNIQFYNQGSNTYDSYESLFVESGKPFVNTSYSEIIKIDGIPAEKLILGKPAITADATNTGYVEPTKLAQICNEGKEKSGITIPGFFIWQYSSDTSCRFYDAFTQNYKYK
ncbi:hypothetical protein ABPG74_002185 [Tetrahymena malaccensis]